MLMFSKTGNLFQRIFEAVFKKIGFVVYGGKQNYAWVDTTEYIKKKSNYVYLKSGAFIEPKPGYVFVQAGTFIETKPGYSYMPDYFLSTRHKQVDIRTLPEFGDLARQVIEQGRTLLGYDRLYTIYQAMQAVQRLTGDGQPISLAEVGVFKGGTSRFMAMCAAAMNLNAKMHSFDTFEGHESVDIKSGVDKEQVHTPGLFNETDFARVGEYLKDFSNISIHKGRFQDTSPEIEREQFHFVHSDVDLYEPTRYILDFMAPRLVSKGVIVVDDYGNSNCPGVVQAVEEFLEQNSNFIRIALLTGQCMLIKD